MEPASESQAALRAGVAALAVGGLAAADGGYFPQSWGWASLGLAWAAAAALLLRERVELGRAQLAMLGLLAAFAGWTLLSVRWSESVPLTALEAERALLYVLALGAFLVVGPSTAGVVVAAAAIGVWNLVAGGAEPVGYENGLALLAVLGILLALRDPLLLAAVPLLLVVLVRADSRGAWLALAAGLAATLLPRVATVAGIAAALVAGATLAGFRPDYWSVALDQAAGAPVLGTGAGTFERVWLRERDVTQLARDAHNLYLETLAELGPFGLALLLAALAVPLVVRPRARTAAGAYAAFLVHAALDWDWEQAALTVAALAAAAAALPLGGRPVPRWPAVAAMAVLASVAAFALAGNALLARNPSAAATAAPWSAEPWYRLALGREQEGELAAARASLREALERDPGDPELWVALARVSDGAERRAALERAARLNPLGVAR